MHANGLVAGRVVAQEAPAHGDGVVGPARDAGDKVLEQRVLAKRLFVPVCIVGLQDEVDKRRGRGAAGLPVVGRRSRANAREVGGVSGGVEDAIDGRCVGLQHAAGSEHLKVGLAGGEDVLSRQQALEEEVAVLVIAAA